MVIRDPRLALLQLKITFPFIALKTKYSPGVLSLSSVSCFFASSKDSTALIQIGWPSDSRMKISNLALKTPSSTPKS